MKVLAITNLFGFPWDPTRGMFNQQQFDLLARRIDFQVLVAVPWTEVVRRPRAWWHARRDGRQRWPYVDYFIFWYPPRYGRRLHAACFFASLLLQKPFKLLFGGWDALLGSWAYPDAVATESLARLTATPVLMKVHGSDVNDYFDEPPKRRRILAAAQRCRAVMCASGALREKLVGAGVAPERVVVNYNGVDCNRFRPAERTPTRADHALPLGAHVVLYVGNLKVAKGCVDLLRAFIVLAQDDPDLLLVYVGDGEARAQIAAEAAEAGLTSRVRLQGKCFHAELPGWFAAADLLCLPSYNEGVPNVVLEAMACGIPVVATRVGGIPEILPGFAGELVERCDVPALAAALSRSIGREWDRGKIVAHARTFSWEANVDRLQALLGEPRQ